MPLSIDTLRAPQPSEIIISLDGEDLTLSYDRRAFSGELVENIYRTPIRTRLSQVLLGWDLTENGAPLQPASLDDPMWASRAQAARLAQALAQKRTAQIAAADAAGLASDAEQIMQIDLTEDERSTALNAPITAAERRAAYSAAWSVVLLALPREFLKLVDDRILDDFLGERWRG